MSTHPADPEEALRAVVSRGGAVVVAGTGVSMSASLDASTKKPHPQASWAGLLENGLEWLQHHNHMAAEEAAAHLTLLKRRGDTHHFISAAEDVTRLMGGVGSKHFEDWLAQTVGTIKAHDRSTLDALETLRKKGNLLATTNYDGLLVDDSGLLKPVTWREPDAFLRAARNQETDKVIFLHGYWRQPSTVILDWNSYQEISRDQRYREELATVWQMTTWLYVGCGFNGLNDPDFGLLLERYGKRARNADLWDFCLVRREQRDQFQTHFDKLQVNIRAISFGDSYEKLPDYLRSLVPATAAAKPAVAAAAPPLVEPITEFLRVTDSFFQYRAPTVAGGTATDARGDFRFTAEEFRSGAVHRAQVVGVALQRLRRDGCVWLEGPSAGGKTTVCLHLVAEWNHRGSEPLYLDLADEPDSEQAARELAAQATPGRMFILDNVHDNPKLACGLLDQWKAQRHDSVIVMLGWPAAIRQGNDYLNGHKAAIVPVAVQLEDWIGVYQSTFRQIRGPGHVAPVPPEQIVKEWDGIFAADLVTFQYALAAGLRVGGGNAFQVEQAAADRHVREKYINPCSAEERGDLFRMAWLAELGVSIGEEATRSQFARSQACGLVRTTLHGEFKSHLRFQPWHRSFGRLLIRQSSADEREKGLCEAAAKHPFSAELLAYRLYGKGENGLAIKVLEETLRVHPSLTTWFGSNLRFASAILGEIRRRIPARWDEICRRLGEPEDSGRLHAQAFETRLNFLTSFLQFAEQTKGLEQVYVALAGALTADAQLPPDQSQLLAKVFATPLGDLVTFLRFTGQAKGFNSVRGALAQALAADTQLPSDRSRFLAQVLATAPGDLVTFLRFSGQTPGFEDVHAVIVQVLTADANLPANQSRLLAQAFATPLPFLITFLQFARQTKGLEPVHTAIVRALNADAKLPADRSWLRAQVFATPLGDLVAFLRFTGQTKQLEPAQETIVQALNDDANLVENQSRLIAFAFTAPLGDLVAFLRFAGQTKQLKSVQAAIVRALDGDARLPENRSRLLQAARVTKYEPLRGFVKGTRGISGLSAVADMIERDPECASTLKGKAPKPTPAGSRSLIPPPADGPTPQSMPVEAEATPPLFRSPLEERIEQGIERVLVEAWKAVPDATPAEERFRVARRCAQESIARLSPHIKRQVGAHFSADAWRELQARDPKH